MPFEPVILFLILGLFAGLVREALVVSDLKALGARGYTITDARGDGTHGARVAAWLSSANIRIEVLCTEQMARVIVEHLKNRFDANFGMVTFPLDVQVLRPGKFQPLTQIGITL
jgi:hypothetical protein